MAKVFGKVELGFYLGKEFSVFLDLFAGVFSVLAADGEVVFVFDLGGLQIGFYACDGGGKVLLGEFAFPDSDDSPGEGVEALGVNPREWMEDVLLRLPGIENNREALRELLPDRWAKQTN